jgi:hypothetical protein
MPPDFLDLDSSSECPYVVAMLSVFDNELKISTVVYWVSLIMHCEPLGRYEKLRSYLCYATL